MGLPLRPLGIRPWLDVTAAAIGIYAAIAGVGWLLFGELTQAALAWIVAVLLLGWAIRGARAAQD